MFSDHLVKHSIPGLLTFSVIKVNQIFQPTQRWLTHALRSLGVSWSCGTNLENFFDNIEICCDITANDNSINVIVPINYVII